MSARVPIFRIWHLVVIVGWYGASAFSVGVVADPEAATGLRAALTGLCFAAALAAPALTTWRAAYLTRDQRRTLLANVMAGAYWAMSFGVFMTGFNLTFQGGDAAPSLAFYIYMAPANAMIFTAFVTAGTALFEERNRGDDAAGAPRD